MDEKSHSVVTLSFAHFYISPGLLSELSLRDFVALSTWWEHFDVEGDDDNVPNLAGGP